MIFVGFCWFLMIVVGFCWFLMIFVGFGCERHEASLAHKNHWGFKKDREANFE